MIRLRKADPQSPVLSHEFNVVELASRAANEPPEERRLIHRTRSFVTAGKLSKEKMQPPIHDCL